MSFAQGRQGSGRHTGYGAGGGRTLAFGQAAGGSYWSNQLRGAGGRSRRIAPSVKGYQMDASSHMVSLYRGPRA
ncbi:hypothetical protein SLEP1_g56389 [Rubroshorea leprosula]|uniref:Uncharacterized protein n=1 Tax=Rubroshorea leprosula TaxID=152421 RepID=A0AAV5MJF3_9ROSI|nr:hypothetical protein SLEP1_g56389 [Rubroshorea leprosula]